MAKKRATRSEAKRSEAKRSEAKRNYSNRTLFHGDNLDFMRSMNSETVDLIATDPPFNKGKDFHATPDSLAAGASFQDRWSWDDDLEQDWIDQIENDWPNVWHVIESARSSWGDDMGAYLCFMGVRLIAMRRLLKPTGSIYLHCDPTASHYLKMLMDAIFGRKNFRNEIVWAYSGGGTPRKDFPRKHDLILRYTKTKNWIFNREFKDYKENTQSVGIHSTLSGPDNTIDLARGTPVTDWWTDCPTVTGWNPERIGYPTQKPLALYERILKASTNKGDMVLDPFAGCATTCVAAERTGRQWVGIDIWNKAQDAVVERMEHEGLKAPKYTRKSKESRQQFLFADEFTFTDELPERTDNEEVSVAYLEPKMEFEKEPWEKLSRRDMVLHLAEAQADDEGWVVCAGCGRGLEVEYMELDHIDPRSGGGSNYIGNRILLCAPCNKKKRHRLTLIGLLETNIKDEWMYDENESRKSLSRARKRAREVVAERVPLRLSIDGD